MLRASLNRCARHYSARCTLTFLFQCICAVTLFSTACYIVDIRSRYKTPRNDFNALHSYSQALWNSSALPKRFAATPKLRLSAIQTRNVHSIRDANVSALRPGSRSRVAARYGVERTECLWTALPETVASAAPLIHLHVFFLHGNAGSHTQGEFWSCAAQYTGRLLGVKTDTYALEWAEQANVHRGRLVSAQADYVADAVEAIIGGVAQDGSQHRVWLVAHSMGGVVARLAAQLLEPSLVVGGVLLLNSPLRFPPLLLDAPMAAVYRTLALVERSDAEADGVPAEAPERGAGGPAKVSSEMLTAACRGSRPSAECAALVRRQRHAARLMSITSGEMDLQIEPGTTYPVFWRSRYNVSFLNTLDRAVCASATSHDGILGEPCAVTLAALRMLSASLADTAASPSAAPGSSHDRYDADVSALAQLPLPPGVVSRAGLLGQLLWRQHMWPWAAVALYSYVLLAGLWPQTVYAVDSIVLRWSAKGGRVWRAASLLRRWLPLECTVPVFLVFLYSCACTYATLLALFLALTGRQRLHSTVYAWQWESLPQLRSAALSLAAPVQFAAATFFFVFASIGPVTVGTNAAMALVAVSDAVRHAKMRLGRCHLFFGSPRRRRAFAFVFPTAVLCVYVLFLVCGVGLAVRSLVWLVVFLALPVFRPFQAQRAEKSDNPLSIDAPASDDDAVRVAVPADVSPVRLPPETEEWHAHHVPGMLFAALYTIQLHPFFAIRNAIVSDTHDDAAMVDWRTYAAEVMVVALLCSACATPTFVAARHRLAVYGSAVASLWAVMAVSWVVAHPIESYRVLPALLCCFPSFALGTLTV